MFKKIVKFKKVSKHRPELGTKNKLSNKAKSIPDWELKHLQSLPLIEKVKLTKQKIKGWYKYFDGKVYVAFSGGKDSTVLLHIVRLLYPKVPGVFLNTGLEYPEIKKFVRTYNNIIWLKPVKSFSKVIAEHGFAVVSKITAYKIWQVRNTKSDKLRNIRLYGDERGSMGKIPDKWKYLIKSKIKISDKCCYYLKKKPAMIYDKETGRRPMLGTMASDSLLRKNNYQITGCNAFNVKKPVSMPLGF